MYVQRFCIHRNDCAVLMNIILPRTYARSLSIASLTFFQKNLKITRSEDSLCLAYNVEVRERLSVPISFRLLPFPCYFNVYLRDREELAEHLCGVLVSSNRKNTGTVFFICISAWPWDLPTTCQEGAFIRGNACIMQYLKICNED